MDDSDYLRLLTIAAEQANAFLSNARKWERERWVCQRLLQGLNIPYRADEFAPAGEPPDVLFRDANFEVFFVLDEGRRLNDEWRDELQRRRSAFSLSQLVRREAKPKRIPANEFLLRLAPTLRKKAHNYKERGMDLGELDIIAFASLKREVLDLNSHFPPPTEYLRQGWRSLSLVGPTFARVLFAHPRAGVVAGQSGFKACFNGIEFDHRSTGFGTHADPAHGAGLRDIGDQLLKWCHRLIPTSKTMLRPRLLRRKSGASGCANSTRANVGPTRDSERQP